MSVGIDIPTFIKLIEAIFEASIRHQGDEQPSGSLRPGLSQNPVRGRLHPQEGDGRPVAIGNLERFISDYGGCPARRLHPSMSGPDGTCVAISARPGQLTAAGELAKGRTVTSSNPSHRRGVLIYNIPEFRLPKAILKAQPT